MTKIIETKDLSYSYGDGTLALKGINISFELGKKVALVGPNGAGKSTLMLMLNGILRPTSGEVLFSGKTLGYDAASLRAIRRAVGMVFQNSDDQLFAPTVYQDVAFGPINLGFPPEKVKRYVGFALQYVGLCGYDRRPPHHLSGGEKKRVAIAGILAMEPEVMILDEPTSNLDPASSEEIMEMLDELNQGGKTLIISTHDVELAYRWADEIILMKDGEVVRRGTGPDVFGDVSLIRDARLKLPLVVDIYMELMNRGIVRESKPPRSILELCDSLQRISDEAAQASGKIYICDVDQVPQEEIRALIGQVPVSFIGAMGTAAKALSERCNISLDFTFGVIDKCILKALTGKSALIMTSGGMIDHTLSRISEYCRESGAKIETTCVNPRQNMNGQDWKVYAGQDMPDRICRIGGDPDGLPKTLSKY